MYVRHPDNARPVHSQAIGLAGHSNDPVGMATRADLGDRSTPALHDQKTPIWECYRSFRGFQIARKRDHFKTSLSLNCGLRKVSERNREVGLGSPFVPPGVIVPSGRFKSISPLKPLMLFLTLL